ncbi:PREDICTED: protein Tube [Ceratosolen solmsi marchali]|uniref:Protein Tube n=1 Tax=Ceratosolen solmsi marchali TaxID=326594 RepID=A0AAJ6YER9_9HYME|nr:PREDICTED: protein Tube [Ceratosolen solmsi marchali]
MTTLDTEIRKLQPVELCTLSQILNQTDSWKKLMAIVPKDTAENHYVFNNEHFIMIEQAIRQQQRSGADIFLSEWSTLNKNRPTCRSMLELLIKAKLFRAADYLAVNILKSDPPKRPKSGPAAEIDLSDKALEELLKKNQAENLKTECQLTEDIKTSWSLNFTEKSINIVDDRREKIEKNMDQYDLVKFSGDKSDLMKFSVSDKETIKELPNQMSDLMKFSNIKLTDDPELRSYVLQEARSEDIPLCVRENAFHSGKIILSETETSEHSTSMDSSDIIQSSISSDQVNLPNVSQNVIPIMVLEYNGNKDKSAT